ncbi:MAG TPA: SRPBCC family protein [Thermoleophilaceae bacterium]|nr:SRPBCC family protein [Thermoleophilaceae bacterium]
MKVERTVEIAASPKRIYDTLMDPACLEHWVTIHEGLVDAPSGKLRKGSKLTQCLKLAGRKFKVQWTVVENEPARRVVWEGKGPVASRARAVYELEPDGEGTRFFYLNEYDLPGGPLGRIAGRTVSGVTTKELEGSLKRLKALVE